MANFCELEIIKNNVRIYINKLNVVPSNFFADIGVFITLRNESQSHLHLEVKIIMSTKP